jgi:hypothetical protein
VAEDLGVEVVVVEPPVDDVDLLEATGRLEDDPVVLDDEVRPLHLLDHLVAGV